LAQFRLAVMWHEMMPSEDFGLPKLEAQQQLTKNLFVFED
jgi:hypothetical protein